MHDDHSISSEMLWSTFIGAVICILLLFGGLWLARVLAKRRQANSKRARRQKGKLVNKGNRKH